MFLSPIPLYNFATHSRAPGDEIIEPGKLVILEGLFALYWPELRALFELKLYLGAPDEVCYERRLKRDTVERGRTPESVKWQFEETVKPMAHLHILPTSQYADLELSGPDPLDLSGGKVLARLP